MSKLCKDMPNGYKLHCFWKYKYSGRQNNFAVSSETKFLLPNILVFECIP